MAAVIVIVNLEIMKISSNTYWLIDWLDSGFFFFIIKISANGDLNTYWELVR